MKAEEALLREELNTAEAASYASPTKANERRFALALRAMFDYLEREAEREKKLKWAEREVLRVAATAPYSLPDADGSILKQR